MDSLITPFQNAFIKGRNIFDNILLAHGIFYFLRKRKRRKKFYGALKIDMTKAYDRVDWKFLKAILISMNFVDIVINYSLHISSHVSQAIARCTHYTSYSLLNFVHDIVCEFVLAVQDYMFLDFDAKYV